MHLTALQGDTADLLFFQAIAPEIIEAYELKPGRTIMHFIDDHGEDAVYDCIRSSMKAHALDIGVETETHHPRMLRETDALRFFRERTEDTFIRDISSDLAKVGGSVSEIRGGFMVKFVDGSMAKCDQEGKYQSCNTHALVKPDEFIRFIGTLDRNLQRLAQSSEMSLS